MWLDVGGSKGVKVLQFKIIKVNMAISVYKFVSWDEAEGGTDHGFKGYYGTIQINWSYDKTAKRITINSVGYNDDKWWAVGSKMKMTIRWSDGAESVIGPDQNYNWNASTANLITTVRGAGFVTKNGVLGIFTAANNNCPVSHTFSGTTGGFTVFYGSTLGTINWGNPAGYRELARISGENPVVTFSTPPNFNNVTITTSNPSVYKLTSSISGISWGIGYSSRSLVAKVKYSIDGTNYEYTAYSNNNPSTSANFSIDGTSETVPWSKVPDGETVTVTWIATSNIGTASGSKTQYCTMQYTAYVIQSGVNNGNPVEADLIVSNTIGSQPNKEIRRITQID